MGAVDSHPVPWDRKRRYGVLAIVTLIYALNIADRFILSTLIEPIKAEFALSDSAIGFLTGSALAIFYCTAGLPLGLLADRMSRRTMLAWTLAFWSVFTALCGVAQNAGHLLLARIGVGVGEAGATPASHSILADYFHPSERIVAMSIFSLGIALGMAVGGIGGGMIAQAFGWRWSLILFACAGAPFLLLLALVREPPRGIFDPPRQAGGDRPGLLASLRFVRANRALLHILVGATIATFAGQGLVWWTPAFLARSHGFSVEEAGLYVGLMNGLGGGAALIGATLITVRLARGGMRGQCHFLAWVTLLIALTGAAAYAADTRGGRAAAAMAVRAVHQRSCRSHLGADAESGAARHARNHGRAVPVRRQYSGPCPGAAADRPRVGPAGRPHDPPRPVAARGARLIRARRPVERIAFPGGHSRILPRPPTPANPDQKVVRKPNRKLRPRRGDASLMKEAWLYASSLVRLVARTNSSASAFGPSSSR